MDRKQIASELVKLAKSLVADDLDYDQKFKIDKSDLVPTR
jgi:hypothetical protein